MSRHRRVGLSFASKANRAGLPIRFEKLFRSERDVFIEGADVFSDACSDEDAAAHIVF